MANESGEEVLDTVIEGYKWSNSDNNNFYEAAKAEGLGGLAEKAGLTTCCDVQILKPYWSIANSVLEVGAGYGRVIEYLLENKFKGKITAVERCDAFFEHLNKKFNRDKNINLLHADIRNLITFSNSFDLIFILWSGIADFSQEEQSRLFISLKNLLSAQGKLIIDTISDNTLPLEAKKYSKQNYIMEINDAVIHVRLINRHEIELNAKKAGFSSLEQIEYKTTTQRQRVLHILS